MALERSILAIAITITGLLALCGCTPSIGVRPSAPLQIVHTHYIPIPASLLQPCTGPPTLGPAATWGDLAQAYISLHAAFVQCAGQVQAIRDVQVPLTPSAALQTQQDEQHMAIMNLGLKYVQAIKQTQQRAP